MLPLTNQNLLPLYLAPTSVLQCDPQQQPSHGFVIGCDGVVSYGGETIFWSCQTGDGDQVNIYTQPSAGNCSQITLVADSCIPDCVNGVPPQLPPPSPGTSSPPPPGSPATETGIPTPTTPLSPILSVTPFLTTSTPPGSGSTTNPDTSPSSPPSPPPPSSSSSSPRPTPTVCPTDLVGDDWEYPHLMVPVDRAHPATAYGPSFFGQLSPNASTLYNFDVPAADAGRSCTLFFAFPSLDEVGPGAYTFTFTAAGAGGGYGAAGFAFLDGAATALATFDDAPAVAADLGTVRLRPGNRYVLASFPCPAGRRVSFALREPDGADTCLYYFQDILPAPFGLYISKC